jgi:predicted enzyme related to lactoylglutathione lyase
VLKVPPECPFGIGIVPSLAATGGGPVLYFACENPAALAEKVVAAGGLMRFGPQKLFGYGEIYKLEYPCGVRWGLYRKGPGSAR